MALFEFDLYPVEQITPWGGPDNPNLSWYALTLGYFRMPVGDQVLFRYRKELRPQFSPSLDADYTIASIARDILGSVASSVATLPPFFELLASDRKLLEQLSSIQIAENSDDEWDLDYTAWRWLGERSPDTGYFVQCPRFYFVRIGDRIHIRWDNRNKYVDGSLIWEAAYGSHDMSVETFLSECRDFSNRLLAVMLERINRIENGHSRPQTTVSIESLREQHETWRDEFDSYFRPQPPDFSWEETEQAIRKIATISGIPLPT